MKNQNFLFLLVFAILCSCESIKKLPSNTQTSKVEYPKLNFNPNQGIIVYKNKPTDEFRKFVLGKISSEDSFDSLKIRKCEGCDTNYMELLELKNLGTDIHGRALSSGTVVKVRTVGGENEAEAFVNIISYIPEETLSQKSPDSLLYLGKLGIDSGTPTNNPETSIVIAVIDTGIDLRGSFSGSNQLWKNPHLSEPDLDSSCHYRGIHGWNFIDNTENIQDDHENLSGDPIYHGTKVSQLIVDQFKGQIKNNIKIMTLKTHNKNGYSELFDNICAIHYAMDHGAQIINASWGFYYDKGYFQDSYFKKLLTEKLAKKGMLFVTAAGNQMDGIAPISSSIDPRNLDQFNFIPAVFGNRGNSIMVATTNIDGDVSPTQNFSSKYVDYGVQAHYYDFSFIPHVGADISERIAGSSYATAILAGKIGANTNLSVFRSRISKREVMRFMDSKFSSDLWRRHKVYKGHFIIPTNE